MNQKKIKILMNEMTIIQIQRKTQKIIHQKKIIMSKNQVIVLIQIKR